MLSASEGEDFDEGTNDGREIDEYVTDTDRNCYEEDKVTGDEFYDSADVIGTTHSCKIVPLPADACLRIGHTRK